MASVGSRAVRQLSLGQRLFGAFKEWYVHACGYRQLGLRVDDLLMEEDVDVEQALKRLPEEDMNLRVFRIKRAMDLSLKHTILPEEHWTKPEEDIRYLTPLIEQAKKERKERELWDKQ